MKTANIERLRDPLNEYSPVKGFEHIIFYSESQPEPYDSESQYVMKCTRCGQRAMIPVPLSVHMFTAMGKVFLKEHRECWPDQLG